jgi:hypothetical protein
MRDGDPSVTAAASRFNSAATSSTRAKGVQVRADERKRETEQTSCDLTRALLRVALEVDLAFPKDEHDVAAGSRTRKLVREEVGPAGAYAVTHIMEGGDELPRPPAVARIVLSRL